MTAEFATWHKLRRLLVLIAALAVAMGIALPATALSPGQASANNLASKTKERRFLISRL